MDVLIVFDTQEGQSERIASRIATWAEARSLSASVASLATVNAPDARAVVVVASVHVGRHSAALRKWLRERRDWLRARRSAFLSVSLGAASKRADSRAEAAAIRDRFLVETGWAPELSLSVAGALRFSRYGFWKRRVLLAISRREGGPDDASADVEFTDWAALERELFGFFEVEPGALRHAAR